MKKRRILSIAMCAVVMSAVALPHSASAPQMLIKSDRGLMAPVWSPTGEKIAVTSDNYVGIWVADVAGNNLKQVTDNAGAGYKMQWSADGSKILGRTNVTVNNRIFHEIKVWNVADFSETTLVEQTRDIQGTPLWKGAEQIALSDLRGAAEMNVLSLKRVTKSITDVFTLMVNEPAEVAANVPSLREFLGTIIINPALSQDGMKVAFQVPGKGIYVCNVDGSDVKYVCKGSHPSWLPDGSIIYTVVKDDGVNFTSSEIYARDITTGKSVLLSGNSEIIPLTPTVTKDGTRVAFENAMDACIYVITLKY